MLNCFARHARLRAKQEAIVEQTVAANSFYLSSYCGGLLPYLQIPPGVAEPSTGSGGQALVAEARALGGHPGVVAGLTRVGLLADEAVGAAPEGVQLGQAAAIVALRGAGGARWARARNRPPQRRNRKHYQER